jgi:hypothetical protein
LINKNETCKASLDHTSGTTHNQKLKYSLGLPIEFANLDPICLSISQTAEPSTWAQLLMVTNAFSYHDCKEAYLSWHFENIYHMVIWLSQHMATLTPRRRSFVMLPLFLADETGNNTFLCTINSVNRKVQLPELSGTKYKK